MLTKTDKLPDRLEEILRQFKDEILAAIQKNTNEIKAIRKELAVTVGRIGKLESKTTEVAI